MPVSPFSTVITAFIVLSARRAFPRIPIITHIISESDMISFLPDFVTREAVESGKLCYLDICDMKIDIWKQLIYHKNKWMSKTLRSVVEYIKLHEFLS